MDKETAARAFWAGMTTIYIGGIVLYFAGIRPRGGAAREVIPVGEPTLLDWVQIGGMLFFTD